MSSYLSLLKPIISLDVVTPPSVEPVTLAEAKLFCKVDFSEDDTLLSMMITAAREQAEAYCRRAFVTQTLRLLMDAPEAYVIGGYCEYFGHFLSRNDIFLPNPPLQSVTSVKFYSTNDALVTVDPSVYEVDTSGERVFLKQDQQWPLSNRYVKTIEVVYVAGYGLAAAVPATIKMAILSHVMTMYDGRTVCAMSEGTKSMLQSPYKVYNRLAVNG